MSLTLSLVVEGQGDAEALPVLIRRIVERLHPGLGLKVATTIRIPKTKLLRPGEVERAIDLAARKARPSGGVMVVIDGDDSCAKHLGPELLIRAKNARPDFPVSVVLAVREYESWFLAAAESLRGKRGLSQEIHPPTDPEAVGGAKEWLSQRMSGSRVYSETLDQPALSAEVDLDVARRAPSFDRLWREVERLIAGRAAGHR